MGLPRGDSKHGIFQNTLQMNDGLAFKEQPWKWSNPNEFVGLGEHGNRL